MKDIKLPKINRSIGAIHPINQTKEFIIDFLVEIGFDYIDGPEIETENFNFEI